jgi:hypothetical protein
MKILVRKNSGANNDHEIFITTSWGVAFDARLIDGQKSKEEVTAIIMANFSAYFPTITWEGWSHD